MRSPTAAQSGTLFHVTVAAVGVRLVIDRPIGTIETNVLETSAILEFAARQGVPTLLASTSEVYGKSSQIPFAEEDDVVYGPPRQARWAYACSKAIDEFLALAYHQQRGLPVVVTRFFNVVGPRQLGEYGMVLPRLIEQVNAGKSMEVHGDGLQTRCFCDVRDVVAVLPTLLDAHAGDAPVVNIGDDRSITILDLAKLVRETLRSEAEIVMVPYEEAFGPGFDDMRHRQPNLRRIREMTGFTPTIELEQTIRDVAAEIAAARQGQPT